jgi:hypothetical protein
MDIGLKLKLHLLLLPLLPADINNDKEGTSFETRGTFDRDFFTPSPRGLLLIPLFPILVEGWEGDIPPPCEPCNGECPGEYDGVL